MEICIPRMNVKVEQSMVKIESSLTGVGAEKAVVMRAKIVKILRVFPAILRCEHFNHHFETDENFKALCEFIPLDD